ncbi:MAG: hypothetical protein EAZ64_00920, partial [Sphingobacteriales bacterium]
PRKVPLSIPSELHIYDVKLSPNGKTIIFEAELRKSVNNNYNNKQYIYSCSVDGTGFKKIVDFDSEFIDDLNFTRPVLGSVN